MKQRNIGLLLPAVLCALVLSACVEPLAAPSPAPTAEPAPAALTVEDLAAVLTGLAPSEGTITWFDEQGEQGSYPAGSAICGEDYTHRLREFQWEALQPYPAWEAEEVYRRIKYTAPGVTLTAFSSLGNDTLALRAVTGDGEGWFTLPSIEDSDPQLQDGQYAWMLYGEVFQPWLEEAESAARYGGDGDGEPLTAEELRWFRDYTASTRSRYHPEWGGWSVGATPVSCFFTCRYDDPRDMDAGEFLYYCPGDGHLEPGNEADEAEFRLVQAHPQMHFWGDG